MMCEFLSRFIFLICLFNLKIAEGTKYDKLVVFLCGRPSLYNNYGEWVKIDQVGCIQSPEDILSFCKKVYPNDNIENIMEHHEQVKVPHWCPFNETNCHVVDTTILPLRCLSSSYKNDALLVPEPCKIGTFNKSDNSCLRSGSLQGSVHDICTNMEMIAFDFIMHNSCGINNYTSIEYVCCPLAYDPYLEKSAFLNKQKKLLISNKKVKDDYLSEYLKNFYKNGEYNEHEIYMKAVDTLEIEHDKNIAKILSDWAIARDHTSEYAKKDKPTWDRLNKNINNKFQKEYDEAEEDNYDERRELKTLHLQRIQAELNARKQKTLDRYLDTIEDSEAQPREIAKTLKHYIKSLEKDKLNSIHHFKHLFESRPYEVKKIRNITVAHIEGLDRLFNEALVLLNRVSKMKDEILREIADEKDSYNSIDTSILVTVEQESENEKPLLDDYQGYEDFYSESNSKDTSEVKNNEEVNTHLIDIESTKKPEIFNEKKNDDHLLPKLTEEQQKLMDALASKADNWMRADKVDTSSSDDDDSKDDKSESSKTNINNFKWNENAAAAHIQDGQMHADQFSLNDHYLHPSGSSSKNSAILIPLGLTVACLTIIAIIIVGIIVLKKRSNRQYIAAANEANLEDEIVEVSPEERHVNNMQVNGYENPTYKYFESNSLVLPGVHA